MFAQLFERLCGRRTATTRVGALLSEQFHRAVHTKFKHIIRVFEVGIGRLCIVRELVHHIGPETAKIGGDHAALRVLADLAWQAEKRESLFKVHLVFLPAFWQRSAWRFFVFGGRLAALDIGTEAA